MASSILSSPDTYNLSGDSIEVEFETDRILVTIGSVVLEFSGSPADGETLNLKWGDNDITFIWKTSPDNSGFQIPTNTGGLPLDQYADLVMERLLQNEYILDNFLVDRTFVGPVEKVRILAKVYEAIDWTVTENLSNTTVVVTDNAGPADENLKLVLKLYQVQNNVEQNLGSLHAPYDLSKVPASTKLDLADKFVLNPHQPSTASILATVYSEEQAVEAVCSFYFRYADKYGAAGTPSIAEALIKSATFYAILGASSKDSIGNILGNAFGVTMHDQSVIGSATSPKDVDLSQPDYFFFFAKADYEDWSARALVSWSDGTQSSIPLKSGIDMLANKAYCFPSGPIQCGIDVQAEKIPIGYRFQIGPLDPQTDDVIERAGRSYRTICDFSSYRYFLLYFNGVGGCETVWLQGRKSETYRVTSEEVQTVEDTLEKISALGMKEYTFNTGYYDESYIKYLRQILLGKIWIVDIENERFLPGILDENKVTDVQDDADPGMSALTFKVKRAALEKAANTF